MGDAVRGGLVKLHGRGEFGQSSFSRNLLANELKDIDGAIEHLHLIKSFLRLFSRARHHAKGNTKRPVAT